MGIFTGLLELEIELDVDQAGIRQQSSPELVCWQVSGTQQALPGIRHGSLHPLAAAVLGLSGGHG